MTQPRRGLGRGLDALFSGISRQSPPEEEAAPEVHEETPEEPAEERPSENEAHAESPAAAEDPADDDSLDEADDDSLDDEEGFETEAYDEDDEAGPGNDDVFEERAAPAAAAPVAPQAEPALPVAEDSAPPPPAYEEPAPVPPAQPAAVYERSRRGPDEVDVDLIAPNPEQPRTNFDAARLHELADSIREHGIIQPLIVSYEDDGTYRLIAGERRLQAARLAGLRRVPVVIREVVDSELLELAIVENVQRADLNPVEEALAFRRLIDEYHLTQEETAQRVGKSRAAIANSLRLLQLETDVRRSLIGGEISEGHARALLGLPEGATRLSALREVIRKGLSVRDTEALVRRNLAAKPETSDSPGAVTARRDVAISDVETRLRRALSTRVTVDPHKGGGARIVIECFSREEFDNVVSRLTDE